MKILKDSGLVINARMVGMSLEPEVNFQKNEAITQVSFITDVYTFMEVKTQEKENMQTYGNLT